MAVLKNLRSLSSMEFYKNAITIRKLLTEWLLKDFGTKRSVRHINYAFKNIDEKDKKAINETLEKYEEFSKKQFYSEYPEWFVNFERNIIIEILQEMISNITSANSIYATKDFEFDLRREYQDKAIIDCYKLYQELQYIISIFNTDLNHFIPFLEMIEKEVDLLKGWRQSDNKARKKLSKD